MTSRLNHDLEMRFFAADLDSSVDEAEDTLGTVLLRLAALEAANNILQEEVDTLKNAAAQQDQINTELQASDNSTNDRLQVVEVDLEDVEVAVQGSACFKIVFEKTSFGIPPSHPFKDETVS